MQLDHDATEETTGQTGERESRQQALGFSTATLEEARFNAISYLEITLGCIAGAVAYLHRQEIKHKDLTPSNILLSSNGLWVTDFGTATDFSVLTTRATENGERGTPKYFAPEVAVYAPSGRAADVFSMGCIFLEIITLCVGYSLQETVQLRSQNDKSFHANLETIHTWFSHGRIASRTCADEHMMGLVRSMMENEPQHRPSAEKVEEEVTMIGGLASASGSSAFCNPCCNNMSDTTFTSGLNWKHQMFVTIGNTYAQKQLDMHTYTFFVTVSNISLVEKVHIYLHQSFRNSHHICEHPPFVFSGRGWGSFDISVDVVLRPGVHWNHSLARPVPRENEKRMLPLSWQLSLAQSETKQAYTFNVVS